MFGLTKEDKNNVLKKIEKQKDFLYSHYIEVGGEKVQLASFFKNTFINADRYIAELQHRVWSLVEYAQNRDLVNVFLTLTLPSEYHPTRTLRNGKIVKNPKYAHQDKILYDIETKEKALSYNQLIFKYYKTLGCTKWTGKINEISLDPKDYIPAKGSKKLTEMFETIRKDRSWQDLDKDDRIYFRVTEPHKSGTPHLHISLWIPKDNVARFVQAVHRFFPAPQADIATTYIPDGYQLFDKVYKRDGSWMQGYKLNEEDHHYIKLQIDDSISYLMKYIYKTLDDLRGERGITEITMWYIHHGICRFYTSRTLISLNVYRPLGGRFNLLELTQHYQDDTVTVWLDPETKQPKIIQYEDYIIWNKKDFELKQYDKHDKKDHNATFKIRTVDVEIDGEEFFMFRGGHKLHQKNNHDLDNDEVSDTNIPVAKMKMMQLWNYYHSLDIDDPTLNLKHYGFVQNTMIERGYIQGEIMNLNDFNTDMEVI
jgi:hypothetical protein